MIFVVGKREAEEGTVTIRRLGSKRQETMRLDEAIAKLTEEVNVRSAPPGFEAVA